LFGFDPSFATMNAVLPGNIDMPGIGYLTSINVGSVASVAASGGKEEQ